MDVRRMLVVDDDEHVRETMAILFRDSFAVTKAAKCSEAVHSARADPPDCLLLDLLLPDGHGFDLLDELLAINPNLEFVVVTADLDTGTMRRGFKKGAVDVLEKPFALCELLACFYSRYEPRAVSQAHEVERPDLTGPLAALSPTELKVAILIVRESLQTKEIASVLRIAESTVKTHRKHIFEKVGRHDFRDPVFYPLRRR